MWYFSVLVILNHTIMEYILFFKWVYLFYLHIFFILQIYVFLSKL